MSWTEDNKTDPQGDWGQGAVNNSIGFGQGVDNAINWGWAHFRTWGHAITNLVGSSVIYGLRFDGSNDTLTGSLSEGDNYLLTISFVPKGTVSRTVYGSFADNSGNYRVIGFGADSGIISIAEPNSGGGVANVGVATVTPGLHTLAFNVNTLGASLDGSAIVGGGSNTRGEGTVSNQFTWGSRITGSQFPAASDVYSITAGSTVMNDANSWGGKTISGATRIQSVDGGVNWTVV